MKTKTKKILSMLFVITLIAVIAVGGMLAYLTDSEGDVNVMTLGNVKIEQMEYQRDPEGNFIPFTSTLNAEEKLALYPAVGTPAWASYTDDNYKFFADTFKNVQDKIVTVKNTGSTAAFVRTIFAFETADLTWKEFDKYIGINVSDSDFDDDYECRFEWVDGDDFGSENGVIEVEGVKYRLAVATYTSPLAPGAETKPSLRQVYLASDATNEICEKFDGEYTILVASQAVQAAGFESEVQGKAVKEKTDAEKALETAFYVVSKDNHPWEGGSMIIPTATNNAEGLLAALDSGEGVILTKDITLKEAVTVPKNAYIDLNGFTLYTMGLDLTKGGTVKNGTIASVGNTYLTPHFKVSGGTLNMKDVTVDVNHHLNANAYWSEATGMEIMNATAVLKDCHVKIHNGTKAQWVYSYGISMNNGKLTMDGGSITATCIAGTAANGPTNPNAISTMGACTATMYDVNVDATYYVTTVNGHATVNTTDKSITSANVVDNSGGSHNINYID